MLARFLTNIRGGVAPLMAVVAIPVMAAVGMAVDYTRANAARTAFQVALDATALTLSKDAATETNQALQTEATNIFNALFSRPEVSNVSVTPVYTTDNGPKLTLSGTAVVNTNFLNIIGISQIDISTASVSTWGNTRLRVALVLDNTGSMNDAGKIGALKTATKNLLTQLQSAAFHPEDVYVSIVPFVKDVNVGPSNYNQSWIRWDLWEEVNGHCSYTTYKNRTNCVSHGKVWTPNNHNTWNGCVTDRDQNYDTTNTAPTAGSTLYPAEQYSACPAATVSGLSNDWTALTAKVDAMTANGNTNQAIGLQLGWQTLTAAPYIVPTISCLRSTPTTKQSTCTSSFHCSVGAWSQSNCASHGGSWVAGVWTPGNYTWTSGVWTPATFTAYTWIPALWTPKAHSTWNGCVMDRGFSATPDNTNNYDTNVLAPDATQPASLYAAQQYGSCPHAIMGLSYDWSAMNALVDSMSAAGNTNQAIGLQVGWLSLIGGGPFTVPPLDPAYEYTQVIILLTDGLNTQDRWYSDQQSIDDRQALTCQNLRTAKIKVYTIQVNTGGDPVSQLLTNCATDTNKHYVLTQADQMTATFTTIGTELTKLRVAQ